VVLWLLLLPLHLPQPPARLHHHMKKHLNTKWSSAVTRVLRPSSCPQLHPYRAHQTTCPQEAPTCAVIRVVQIEQFWDHGNGDTMQVQSVGAISGNDWQMRCTAKC
jgi:hypothetical protein